MAKIDLNLFVHSLVSMISAPVPLKACIHQEENQPLLPTRRTLFQYAEKNLAPRSRVRVILKGPQ